MKYGCIWAMYDAVLHRRVRNSNPLPSLTFVASNPLPSSQSCRLKPIALAPLLTTASTTKTLDAIDPKTLRIPPSFPVPASNPRCSASAPNSPANAPLPPRMPDTSSRISTPAYRPSSQDKGTTDAEVSLGRKTTIRVRRR